MTKAYLMQPLNHRSSRGADNALAGGSVITVTADGNGVMNGDLIQLSPG